MVKSVKNRNLCVGLRIIKLNCCKMQVSYGSPADNEGMFKQNTK